MTTTHRTTVAIPLHASARWHDVIGSNIDRLARHAHIVVSDPTGLDEALPRLRVGREHVEGIEWRTTATAPGWVGHCNALLAEATTEFFMWLPHDDEIDATWIRDAERALDVDPAAMLAVGSVAPVGKGVDLPFNDAFASADPEVRVKAALTDLVSARAVSLGLLFRSVFRRDGAHPLPDAEWADVPWAIAMLASGRAAQTQAVYRKRWHPSSVSAGWSPMAASPDFRSTHIAPAVALLGDSAPVVVAHAWEAEVAQMANRATALENELAAVGRTPSMRSTTPLRRLRARLEQFRASYTSSRRD